MKDKFKEKFLPVQNSINEVAELAEGSIDIFVDNKFLADIPFVSTAKNIYKIKDAYRLAKLKRNYCKFVDAIKSMNEEESQRLHTILFSNSTSAEEAFETIFDIVSEGERPEKAQILGNLCCSLARQKLTMDDFTTLLHITRSASMPALKAIPAYIDERNGVTKIRGTFDNSKYEALLLSLGIAIRKTNIFDLTKLGKTFAECGFKKTLRS